MKKALILSGMLLALSASYAVAAPSLNLKWNDCLGPPDGGAEVDRIFACNTNLNTLNRNHQLYGFYVAPAIPDFVGVEVVVDYLTAGGQLAPWWDFNNCRAGQLVNTFRSAQTSCLDWPGTAGVAGNMTVTNISGDRARIVLTGAYTSGTPQVLVDGSEYVAFNLTINNGSTVGTPSCAGCLTAACIVLNQITLGQLPAKPVPLAITAVGPSGNHVTWQGGAGTSCPGATPARRSSWGKVKAIYR